MIQCRNFYFLTVAGCDSNSTFQTACDGVFSLTFDGAGIKTILRFHTFRGEENIMVDTVIIDFHQRLCCSITESGTSEHQVEWQNHAFIFRQCKSSLFRYAQCFIPKIQLQLQTVHIMPQCIMVLKVYHENESAVIFHPGSITQIITIFGCHLFPTFR